MDAKIQFIKGLDEKVLPDIKLTRSRDGSTGTATFRFKNPDILDKSTAKEGKLQVCIYLTRKEFLKQEMSTRGLLMVNRKL